MGARPGLFGFLAAIIAIIVALYIYAFLRKRRVKKAALLRSEAGLPPLDPWSADVVRAQGLEGIVARAHRRGLRGRVRYVDTRVEEGLNADGESPPQYMPKEVYDEQFGSLEGPDIPLQTLSREEAGLRPPEYIDGDIGDVDRPPRHAVTSTSTSES